MLNEGLIVNDTKAVMKSEMLRQLWRLGSATPHTWERAVFKSLTGHEREDVDWDAEDNQAGAFTWFKSFDRLIEELIDDGYVKERRADGSDERELLPTDHDPAVGYSHLVHAPRH